MGENIQPRENDEITIDLREVFHELWTHIIIIILAGVLCALAGFLITKLVITPLYTSTTKIYVLNKTDANSAAVTYSDLNAGSQLTQDYMELVESRPVLEQVISVLNLDMTPEALAKEVTVSNPDNTRILSIDVRDADPKRAKDIANALREAVSIQIMDVMDSDAVNTVEEASLADAPSSPSTTRNVAIGFLLGIVGSMGVILLIYVLNDTIKTPDDVERYLGMNVLAAIPIAEGEGKPKKIRKNTHWSKTKMKGKS